MGVMRDDKNKAYDDDSIDDDDLTKFDEGEDYPDDDDYRDDSGDESTDFAYGWHNGYEAGYRDGCASYRVSIKLRLQATKARIAGLFSRPNPDDEIPF